MSSKKMLRHSSDDDVDLTSLGMVNGQGGSNATRRPPVYNAEDYVAGLKRFCKLTGLQMYLGDSEGSSAPYVTSGSPKKSRKSSSGGRNSQVDGNKKSEEMGLRQFDTVSEMLAKLKADLTLSVESFVQEFLNETNDGVTLLLDLLKAIQLSQTNITGSLNQLGSRANHVMFKRALSDEFEVLLCLKTCARHEGGAASLVKHPSGLFTVAVCVMSNYSKSRILSLQLLARLCEMPNGHKQVSDAISMLRLRFGEPVRFKFLVGMLNSYNSAIFQIACLRFLNRFVETAKDARERIMVQTELEEAGFDLEPLSSLVMTSEVIDDVNGSNAKAVEMLQDEIERWSKNYIDVNNLVKKLLDAERANRKLREEVNSLKKKLNETPVENNTVVNKVKPPDFNTVDRLKQCCEHLQSEIDKRQRRSRSQDLVSQSASCKSTASKKSIRPGSTSTENSDERVDLKRREEQQPQQQKIDVKFDDDDDDVPVYDYDEDDEEDDDVLLLLPSNVAKEDLPFKKKLNKTTNTSVKSTVVSGVSITDDAGSLVTVLATDGYTCITSPVARRQKTTQTEHEDHQGRHEPRLTDVQRGTGYSGDSGLSSDSSEHNHQGDKRKTSTDSAKDEHATESSVSSDDLEAVYAERNVLHEEDITVQTEQISIDRFKQRFGAAHSSCSSSDIGAIVETKTKNSKQKQSQQQPQQRSRSEQKSKKLDDSPKEQAAHEHDDAESLIVPQRTPRPPPARQGRLPKQQFQPQPAGGRGQPGERGRRCVSEKRDTKKKDVVVRNFSDDLDTSDDFSDDFDPEIELAMNLNREPDPNTNTMETMSARSFGFIKPSTVQRQHDFANRVRRHKSFFVGQQAEPSGTTNGGAPIPAARGKGLAGSRGNLLRRAETFHHSRSLNDFDNVVSSDLKRRRELYQKQLQKQQQLRKERGKSEDRLLKITSNKSLSKSKSMEFLKAKLLSKKSTKPENSPTPSVHSSSSGGAHHYPPPSTGVSRLIREFDSKTSLGVPRPWTGSSSNSSGGKDYHEDKTVYDWRQDTPFWNKKGRWSRPPASSTTSNGSKKIIEEPWVVHQKLMVHEEHLPNGATIQHHPVNGGNGWPATPQIYPGLFLGKAAPKLGSSPGFLPYGAPGFGMYVPQPHMGPPPSNMNPEEELFRSRLEITELSDEELPPDHHETCPTPDYSTLQQHGPGFKAFHGGPMLTPTGGNRNILDMPSGLY